MSFWSSYSSENLADALGSADFRVWHEKKPPMRAYHPDDIGDEEDKEEDVSTAPVIQRSGEIIILQSSYFRGSFSEL